MRFASDDHQHRPVRHLNRWTSVRIRHQPLRRGVRASSARALAHTVRWRATHYGFIALCAGTWSMLRAGGLCRALRARKTTNRAAWAANTLQAKASIGPPGETIHKRHRGDSNPCGQSPMDFESISLTARTQCQCCLFFLVKICCHFCTWNTASIAAIGGGIERPGSTR